MRFDRAEAARFHRGHGKPPGHAHPEHPDPAPVARHAEVSSTPGGPAGATGTADDTEAERSATGARREIEVRFDLLDENRRHAASIRERLREAAVFAVNLMSSPGAGKTALLEVTLPRLGSTRAAVLEGDIETSADAERLAPFGVPDVQINTGPFGGDCHLPAPLVADAMEKLPLAEIDLLFIENVGNLVCPAEFDLGEARKVVLLSVTEGEDKPLKYPLIFRESSLALITKTDLLPHLDFDLPRLEENLRRVNPELKVVQLSTRSGEGLEEWLKWLADERGKATHLTE